MHYTCIYTCIPYILSIMITVLTMLTIQKKEDDFKAFSQNTFLHKTVTPRFVNTRT